MKKLLAIILSVLLVLTVFASCGKEENAEKKNVDLTAEENAEKKNGDLTAEEILAKSVEASENIEGFGINADLEMSMSSLGESVDMTYYMNIESCSDAIYILMNMDMGTGELANMETYVDMSQNPIIQYVGTDGAWIKLPVEVAIAEQYKNGDMQMDLSMYSEYMKQATVEETEHNGVACYEVSGIVDVDFNEFMKSMNMDSLIGDLEALGLSEDFYEKVFADVEPFTMVLGINKDTFLPEYANVDMTEMMDVVVKNVLKLAFEQTGLDESALGEMGISKCIMNATYRDYNNTHVEIPAEVVENASEYAY